MSHSYYILTYTSLQILERKRKRGRRKIDTIKTDRFIRERQNKQPFITGKQVYDSSVIGLDSFEEFSFYYNRADISYAFPRYTNFYVNE